MGVPSLDYGSPAPPSVRPPKTSLTKTLRFRQTAIPILLTTGVMMLIMGIARWVIDEDAPLARVSPWVAVVLVLTGLALIGLGVANMLFVRSELDKPR